MNLAPQSVTSVFDISLFAARGVSAHPCSRKEYRQHPNTSEEIKVKFVENLGADIKKIIIPV